MENYKNDEEIIMSKEERAKYLKSQRMKRYQKNHPEVFARASKNYRDKNPEFHVAYYNDHKLEFGRKLLLKKLEEGKNIKVSTLTKYGLNPENS